MNTETGCIVCGSKKYQKFYEELKPSPVLPAGEFPAAQGKAVIVKCQSCGMIYRSPLPAEPDLLRHYADADNKKYLDGEAGVRLAARGILQELKGLKKTGRILDIGCAAGFLLDEAKKDGWEVYGVDLSARAKDYAKNKFGLDIFQGSLKDATFPDKHFDTVVIKNTLEHIRDPKDTLKEVRRVLKPDGILCINTPNIESIAGKIWKRNWWAIKSDHLYYFSRKTLYNLLETAGFKPVKYRSRPHILADSELRRQWLRARLSAVNLGDQLEVYSRKLRRLEYLDELENDDQAPQQAARKVIAVLPAYNAAKTLKITLKDIPKDYIDEIILVDDASSDATVELAKELGLKVFAHRKNKGYGANQKTCYLEALKAGADIVVMVHPDYQYDPRVIPELIQPIKEGRADAVFGSRMMKGGALEGGMPLWKHNANILLTALENVVLGTYLTEYHSGFRAYSARYLRSVNFMANSDGFVFDTEIIVQGLLKNMRFEEIPIRTRYFDEASTIKLWPSILYGIGILKTLLKFVFCARGLIRFKQFE